jgi:hypothetical protein
VPRGGGRSPRAPAQTPRPAAAPLSPSLFLARGRARPPGAPPARPPAPGGAPGEGRHPGRRCSSVLPVSTSRTRGAGAGSAGRRSGARGGTGGSRRSPRRHADPAGAGRPRTWAASGAPAPPPAAAARTPRRPREQPPQVHRARRRLVSWGRGVSSVGLGCPRTAPRPRAQAFCTPAPENPQASAGFQPALVCGQAA